MLNELTPPVEACIDRSNPGRLLVKRLSLRRWMEANGSAASTSRR
jgi:hypothetical protein